MSTLTAAKRTEVKPAYGPTDWLGGWSTLIWGYAAIIALFLGLQVYEMLTAWGPGLDASSPEFTKYYRSLFWAEVLGVGAFTGLWWGWLIRSGRALANQAVDAKEKVRRIATFWGLVGITSLILYFMASFFPNQDGSWHQTAVRDTALTPPHIVMFYLAFPLGITFSVGTYLYGRTRLPEVYGADKGFPWSHFLLIAASVTEMIQVAFNEWGHSLWIAEEFFAAPFHWPFVTYGWLAGGIFALWAETIVLLYKIEKEIEGQPAAAVAGYRG